MDSGALIVVAFIILLAGIILARTAIVVPQQSAFVVERLGKYAGTLGAGFHILTPFVDVIRYRHSLKEQAIDIPEQICITRDNVQVGVDGILYMKVLNPERASYGISDFGIASRQLAQTNLRSEIGKIDLDRTFEERTTINAQAVSELDKATEPWGVKVLHYEIKTITPMKRTDVVMVKRAGNFGKLIVVKISSDFRCDARIISLSKLPKGPGKFVRASWSFMSDE